MVDEKVDLGHKVPSGVAMKKYFLLSLLISGIAACVDEVVVPESAFLVDSIQAVVFGQEEPQIVTYSDVARPSLSGQQRGLDELVFERLVFGDAQKFQIMTDEDAVDKYLAMIQKQNNLTLDELKNVFADAGYSYEEGRQQFRLLQTVNAMLDFKIRTQVVVPRALVEQYHAENPAITEAKATVQRGFIPYVEDKLEKQKKAFEYMAKTGKEVRDIQWGDPFELSESEVSSDKAFLFALAKGDISQAHDIGIGFEVFRAVETSPRTQATLEERYKEIADTLRKPIYEELLENYKKSLMDASSVLYLQPVTGAVVAPTTAEAAAVA